MAMRLIHKRFMTEDQAALRKTLTKDSLDAWRFGQEPQRDGLQTPFATCCSLNVGRSRVKHYRTCYTK